MWTGIIGGERSAHAGTIKAGPAIVPVPALLRVPSMSSEFSGAIRVVATGATEGPLHCIVSKYRNMEISKYRNVKYRNANLSKYQIIEMVQCWNIINAELSKYRNVDLSNAALVSNRRSTAACWRRGSCRTEGWVRNCIFFNDVFFAWQ